MEVVWGKIDARAESVEKMNGQGRRRAVELRGTRGKEWEGKAKQEQTGL